MPVTDARLTSMNRRLKITSYVVCLLAVFLLEGCISLYSGRWTSVNMGAALNNAGMTRPYKQRVKTDDEKWLYYTRVWKKDDSYIVEVPIAFVPFNPPIIEHSAGHRGGKKSLENRYWGPTDEEVAQYPAEPYYAVLSQNQFQRLCLERKVDAVSDPFPELKLIPSADMNFRNSTLIFESDVKGNIVQTSEMEQFYGDPIIGKIRTHSISPRRTCKNYILRPVSWLAYVADIPLTIVATPIGWLVDAIYEPLHN